MLFVTINYIKSYSLLCVQWKLHTASSNVYEMYYSADVSFVPLLIDEIHHKALMMMMMMMMMKMTGMMRMMTVMMQMMMTKTMVIPRVTNLLLVQA